MNQFFNNLPLRQEEEDSDDDYDQTEFLNDTNPDFIKFKEHVREWIMLDDDIKTLQKAITDRKKRKTELTPYILKFMNEYELKDLETHGGKLQYAKSFNLKPMNKQFIISKLSDYFKDISKGEKVASFILDNRDREEKVRLKRVLEKKKPDIIHI